MQDALAYEQALARTYVEDRLQCGGTAKSVSEWAKFCDPCGLCLIYEKAGKLEQYLRNRKCVRLILKIDDIVITR